MKKMGKWIIFIIFFFCSTVLYAQNDHLFFLGIPIDGTITEFQEKLEEKGILYDAHGSKMLPIGLRSFKGYIEGESCNITVFYTKSSKTVYCVKLCLDFDEYEQEQQMFNMINDALRSKFIYKDEDNDDDGDQLITYKAPNGEITLFTLNLDFGYGLINPYYLHLQFTDSINSKLPDAK